MSEAEENKIVNPARKYRLSLGVILFFIAGILIFQRFSFSKDDFTKVMNATSAELNKTCPKMEDADTRLDNTEVLPDKVFQYNYTLMNFTGDSLDVEMLYASFEPAMVNNARENPDLELFRKNHVTFIYHFRDQAGKFITR